MSNKIFLGAVMIVLIMAAYVIYQNYSDEDAIPISTNGVSFICEDNTDFIADFTIDMSEVSIIIRGELDRTLYNVGDSEVPYRFTDNLMVYTFVGEEAIVTDVASEESFVCRQPSDSNNAPYNFGDTGENGGQEADRSAIGDENILGVWRSLDDRRFNREFRADGSFVDIYEGDNDTLGIWRIYNGNELGEDLDFEPDNDAIYLMLTDDITPELVMHFRINKLTPEEMELTYMERGNILRFTYVGPNTQ